MSAGGPQTAVAGGEPSSGRDLAARRQRAEELVFEGSYGRALHELEAIRKALSGEPAGDRPGDQPGNQSGHQPAPHPGDQSRDQAQLALVEQRIKEVGELRVMADVRLRDHLERGQFFLNHHQYLKAISVWESDPELEKNSQVKERIAFARSQMERLEKGIALVKEHLARKAPEAALVELAKTHPLDPENSMLWHLERNAQSILLQKQVTSLKEEVLRGLEAEDYEAATAVLERIAEVSQHIVTVRWLRGVRSEAMRKVLPRIREALSRGDRPAAEKMYRWIIRLSAPDGSFDSEVERLRGEFGLSLLPAPGAQARSAAPGAPSRPASRPPTMLYVWRFFGPRLARPLGRGRIAALGAGLVFLLLLGHQAYNLVWFRYAGRLSREGRFEEALSALGQVRLPLTGGESVRHLRREIASLSSVARAREALDRRGWTRAEGLLGSALEEGRELPRVREAIEAAFSAWRSVVGFLAASGDLRDAWGGFEVLGKLEARLAATRPGTGGGAAEKGSHDFALQVGRSFLKRNAFPEAIGAARRAQAHPLAGEEVSSLLSDIQARMLAAAESALQAEEFDQAQAIYRLLEAQLPETVEVERHLRSVEFLRAMRDAQRALDQGELPEAQEAYRTALESRPEGEQASSKLRALRDRISKLRSSPGGARERLLPSGESDLAEAASIALNGHRRHRLSEEPEALSRSIYWQSLRGSWTMVRDPVQPAQSLIVAGKVALGGGEYVQPVGDIRIGVVLIDGRGTPVAGEVVKVPLLLPGGSKEFEVRLPSAGAEYIQVGISTP